MFSSVILILMIVAVALISHHHRSSLLGLYTTASRPRIVTRSVRDASVMGITDGANSDPSTTTAISYELAARESFGFFTDIPDREWMLKKKICKNRKHVVLEHRRARVYFQSNWNPDFACGEAQMVANIGQGGHWVCDAWRFNAPPPPTAAPTAPANTTHQSSSSPPPPPTCVVYTVGAASAAHHNFAFERALKAISPRCEIHVFDHVDYSDQVPEDILTFHHVGIRGSNGWVILDQASQVGITFQSLPEMAKSLGHERIDYLRLDCESCEYAHYNDIGLVDIRQLVIMFHDMYHIRDLKLRKAGKTTKTLNYLHNLGYVIFHKDSNLLKGARHMELSFLKLDKSFQDLPG